jgi:putative transposase
MPITVEGTLGIDLGLKHFATLSTGEKIENPRHLRKSLKKLKRAQRQHSRKKKGSKNREKARQKIALIHEKVTNQRKDFLHKLTTKLIHDNQVDSIAIEDLAVKNMVKNHCVAQSISDASWREFRRQIEYKADRKGKNVLVIGRFAPSSKTCLCGEVKHSLRLRDRTWTCSRCGLTHDRDINAAQNIKAWALYPHQFIGRGTPEFTLGEIPITGSLNQESQGYLKMPQICLFGLGMGIKG